MLDYATADETSEASLNHQTESREERRRRYSREAYQRKKAQRQSENQSSSSGPQDQPAGSGDPLETEESKLTPTEKKRLSGLSDLLANVVVGVGLVAAARNSEALQKDAIVLAQRKDSLAEKWVRLGRVYPELAKATDRVLKATPIGAFLGELAGIGFLIASNHGVSIPGLGVAQAA